MSMREDLFLDPWRRLLDGLGVDPWPELVGSGFLDLLRPEAEGGAGLDLAGLFPLAFEVGRRSRAPRVLPTLLARLADPQALDCPDAEPVLAARGKDPVVVRALCAAVDAAQMAGAIDVLQAMTLDYASTRQQFGREISKFQAIQHQIAVMAEEVMAARMAAEIALAGPPLSVSVQAAAVAKMRCGEAAMACAGIAHAIHGAIGVSAEHDLHHFTGTLHRLRLAHGGEAYWARKLGAWALSRSDDAATLVRSL
jgi:alkylation response protein AidB-like acyl-CoA dehydrogenase